VSGCGNLGCRNPALERLGRGCRGRPVKDTNEWAAP
jgi:hypothetical protein